MAGVVGSQGTLTSHRLKYKSASTNSAFIIFKTGQVTCIGDNTHKWRPGKTQATADGKQDSTKLSLAAVTNRNLAVLQALQDMLAEEISFKWWAVYVSQSERIVPTGIVWRGVHSEYYFCHARRKSCQPIGNWIDHYQIRQSVKAISFARVNVCYQTTSGQIFCRSKKRGWVISNCGKQTLTIGRVIISTVTQEALVNEG